MTEQNIAESRQIAESRLEAIRLGLKFYYGRKPCQKGCEKPIRRTCNRHCVKCTAAYHKAWLTPERNRIKEQRWRERHREAYRKYQREYHRRWYAARRQQRAEAVIARADQEAHQ